MEKWYVSAKKADFDKWAKEFHISPVLARILRNRELTDEQEIRKFLYGTLEDCYSPWLLKDMDKAVEVLKDAIAKKKYIRVIGDYDVDGICSAYILTKGLKSAGAQVDTAIPHRIHDGYGLNEHLIQEAHEDGVELIITCDNGIAAAPRIQMAKELGIDVVVTDHHEVPFVEEHGVRREVLPDALAVVDPKQEQCKYPFPSICGAVVAYKVVQALGESWNGKQTIALDGDIQGEDSQEKHVQMDAWQAMLDELLEFAALATVCDVMELRDENRIIVKEGLKRIRRTKNPGLQALIEVNQIEPERIASYHLGFVIGPCLNATGRLDTAQRALELLQSTTKVEAMSAARELKDLNDQRKEMTLKGIEEAEDYIREHQVQKDKVMIIYLPKVHESLAGIIAGRIRERYHHPVFVLTKSEEGVKGSGRSIDTYHMYEGMTGVKEYFTKYGGHKLAAGLSMREEDIEDMRRDINAKASLTEEDFIPKVHIDVPMPMEYATEELAEQLETLEPFGVGNSKPLFAQKNIVLTGGFKMGRDKSFAKFRGRTAEGKPIQMVYFGDLDRFGAFLNEKYGAGSENALYDGVGEFPLSVVYQLGLNTYRGKTELQFVMQYYC